MEKILIRNGRILTCASKGPKYGEEMSELGIIENGFIYAENGNICEVGCGSGVDFIRSDTLVIDATDKLVIPGLVDPHTHILHYGSRENEFLLKLKGEKYLDILKQGGGILSTVNSTRQAEKEELKKKVETSLDIMLSWGTTYIEAKSGYGLNLKDEAKCLELVAEINHPIEIVPTFMGAHAVPSEYKDRRDEYISLLIDTIIPYIAQHKLAEYIDVFCETGVFSYEECEKILICGKKHGLIPKIHADEIESIGGTFLAASIGAISAEHLIKTDEEGIKALKSGNVIPVLLPGTAFFLGLKSYAPARKMINAGLPVAIATDYNPGTCPTESLQSIFIFAAVGMRLTPSEIINAATINAACAIGRDKKIGSIEKGKQADIVIMDVPNENYLIYHFGINHVHKVIKRGKLVVDNAK